MCEYEHLLEHKKFDLDFLCGNGTITTGGGYFFPNTRVFIPCSTKEWDNSYIFFKFKIFFFNSLCLI
jgi:hypothetical protein